ncbi:MAG: hypothetical protein GY701_25320 [Sulfitobacter sp.]|uniref:holin family protein n=1 Tax=Sphingomonas sp. TaxID=28214 RepID=UPI0025840CB7|nr:holin family protein [Sphingomonas sp.]MCP3881680.1 hypothetical protein [Sulfitobacter sp.]MCP4029339.1 hypothetical protein [Sphingomonas sp.]
MSLLAAATALMPVLSDVIDRVFPDPEQKAKAQLELIRLQQEGAFKELDAELQINLAQARINEAEAQQSGWFRGGWRPAAGWVCVAGLGYEFLLRPLLPWVLAVCGVDGMPDLPSLAEVLFELLFGMLGLGTMRTAERWKRTNAVKDIATK